MENDDHFPDLVINHYQPLSIISHYQLTIINRGHRATCWARWLTQGTQGPGDWSGMVMWEGTTNLLDPVRTFPKKLRLNSLLKFLLTRYSLEKIRSILSDAKKLFHPRWERPTLLPPKKTCRVAGTYLPAIDFQYGMVPLFHAVEARESAVAQPFGRKEFLGFLATRIQLVYRNCGTCLESKA